MPSTPKWKLKAGVTWRDKLHAEHPNHGKIVPANAAQRKQGIETVLIPRPLDVHALVRRVGKGRVVTVSELRDALARRAGADIACPMTTGIFLRIIAEAAEEAAREGKKRITPYWRVVDADGGLKAKFPGGVADQARRLRAEGIRIVPAEGKKPPRVQDLQRHTSTL